MSSPNARIDDLSWVHMSPPPGIDRLEWRARIAAAVFARDYAQWSWFLTLTFRADVSERTALRAFRWLLRELAQREFGGQHFKFARVMDRQKCGRLHFHALVEVPTIPIAEPQRAIELWQHYAPRRFCTGSSGNNLGQFFWVEDRVRPALYLFAKHRGHEVNVACPRTGPCARQRCVVAATGFIT